MRRMLIRFLRDRHGGGMLYAGAFGLMLMASVGTMMTNYAWQEAQHEELRGALRAAVSASSRLLAEVSDTNVQGANQVAHSRLHARPPARAGGGRRRHHHHAQRHHPGDLDHHWRQRQVRLLEPVGGAEAPARAPSKLPSVRVGVALDRAAATRLPWRPTCPTPCAGSCRAAAVPAWRRCAAPWGSPSTFWRTRLTPTPAACPPPSCPSAMWSTWRTRPAAARRRASAATPAS